MRCFAVLCAALGGFGIVLVVDLFFEMLCWWITLLWISWVDAVVFAFVRGVDYIIRWGGLISVDCLCGFLV